MITHFNSHFNFLKSILMKVVTLDGINNNFNIHGFGATAPPDKITLMLMSQQTELIQKLKKKQANKEHILLELSKIRHVILLNGTKKRDIVLKIMPFVKNIDQYGQMFFSDNNKVQQILKENNLSGLGFDLNPFNNSAGGATWTKNEANKYYFKLPGKIESIRTVIKNVIGQDVSNVEVKNQGDYAGILEAARKNSIALEERWLLLQGFSGNNYAEINNGYLGNSSSYMLSFRDLLNSSNQFNIRKSGITITVNKTAEPSNPRLTIDQVQSLINKYALKDNQGNSRINFNGGFNSPNLSSFPQEVIQQIYNNGYWFALIAVPWASDGFDNATNRAEAKFQYENILSLEDWANKTQDQLHRWVTVSLAEKAWQGVKTIGLAPLRGLIIGIILLNVRNFAWCLSKVKTQKLQDFEKIKTIWLKGGGNRTEFAEAVEKGKRKKPLFGSGVNGLSNTINDETIDLPTEDDLNIDPEVNSDNKTLKIPQGIGASIATIGATINSAAAAYIVPAGVVIESMTTIINSAKVLLGKDDDPEGDNSANVQPEWKELGFSSEAEYKTYLAHGGAYNANQGSFSTGTIDTLHDLFNFLKASLVISLACSIYPYLFVYSQIGIIIAFIYALRKKLFKSKVYFLQ